MDLTVLFVLSLLGGAIAFEACKRRGYFPENVNVKGPILTVYTRRGEPTLDSIAGSGRLWRLVTNLGAAFSGLLMIVACAGVLAAGYVSLSGAGSTGVSNPRNALLIPGVNDFLPLSVAGEIVLAAVIAIVIHELGHGVLCRIERIPISSMGVTLLAYIPLGAFVAVDPESSKTATWTSRTRTFAAGVTVNFLIGGLCLLVLALLVTTVITPVSGAAVGGVAAGSASADADLERGDVLVAVDGTPVANETAFDDRLESAGETVDVETKDGRSVAVDRKLQVNSASPEAPLGPGETVERINGTAVATERQFDDAVANRTTVTVDTGEDTVQFVPGAAVRAVDDGALAAAGAPTDERLIITHVDGHRTPNSTALIGTLGGISPGETISVRADDGGDSETYTVELPGDGAGDATLGVTVERGTTGLELDDFGTELYPTSWYTGVLGGEFGFLSGIALFFALPVAGFVDAVPFNFAGFTGDVQAFYTVAQPIAGLDGAVFLFANLLFWSAWVNLNLGLFNCFPIFPLDGGRLLYIWTDVAMSPLPDQYSNRATATVTGVVSASMVVALLMMLFA